MRNRGQSTLEYAVIIAVVVAGLLAIQVYMKRGVEGKLRESTDRIGEQYSAGNITAKYTTQQTEQMETKETFGLNEAGAYVPSSETVTGSEGISIYRVKTPAEIQRRAQESDAETVTKKLADESLF